jgi:hypothetical protein
MLKVNCTVDREQTRRSRGKQEVVEWWSDEVGGVGGRGLGEGGRG